MMEIKKCHNCGEDQLWDAIFGYSKCYDELNCVLSSKEVYKISRALNEKIDKAIEE